MKKVSANMRGITISHSPKGHIATRSLCESCGDANHCDSGRQKVVRLDSKKDIYLCNKFVPTLKFVNPRGTQSDFNTFRTGDTWVSRVRLGSKVALMDKDEVIFGYANVTAVHTGDLKQMERYFGIDNHTMRGLSFPTQDDAVSYFAKRFRSSVGGLIYDNNENATVIYLQREQ